VTGRPDRDEPAPRRDEGFLGRWSRLKRTTRPRGDPPPEDRAHSPAAAAVSERAGSGPGPGVQRPRLPGGVPAAVEAPPPSSALSAPETGLDLPPLETLGSHSDFRPFLAPEVSPDLRREALRRLFHLPELNVRDGLTDYWEDYTTFEPLGDLIPHEMRASLEREARRLAEAALDASGGPGPGVSPGARAVAAGTPGEGEGAARDAVAPQRALAGHSGRTGGVPDDTAGVAGGTEPASAGHRGA
jgi:hypothetical protein